MDNVILFDGVCNLCNFFVQFVIKRDKKNIFQFASLQSKYGKDLLKRFDKDNSQFESVVLFNGVSIFTESTAALIILKKLGNGWALMYFFIILPKFMRDAVYRFIARNRYRWFGKMDYCMVPTEELKNKFIE